MTPPHVLFHALLRPCVLQILRATGYHATRPAVLDSLTDLAAQYLLLLCRATARHAMDHDASAEPTIVDVRMALEECGALVPEKVIEEQQFTGLEDTRGVEDFIAWAMSARNKEIRRIALDGDEEAPDYLTALKKKHSKTGEDSKYHGTVLGKGNEHGDILVEGGECDSIRSWIHKMKGPTPRTSPEVDGDSRPPSSGLSSLGDRTILDEMDFS